MHLNICIKWGFPISVGKDARVLHYSHCNSICYHCQRDHKFKKMLKGVLLQLLGKMLSVDANTKIFINLHLDMLCYGEGFQSSQKF